MMLARLVSKQGGEGGAWAALFACGTDFEGAEVDDGMHAI
jgi:hypothetical protein